MKELSKEDQEVKCTRCGCVLTDRQSKRVGQCLGCFIEMYADDDDDDFEEIEKLKKTV